MYFTLIFSEDIGDNTSDENTAMIDTPPDTTGESNGHATHTKQRSGDKVYSVASTRTIEGMMTEFKKRKKTQSMPTFVRATRSARYSEHAGTASSDSVPPQIEQEHRNSVMKVSCGAVVILRYRLCGERIFYQEAIYLVFCQTILFVN